MKPICDCCGDGFIRKPVKSSFKAPRPPRALPKALWQLMAIFYYFLKIQPSPNHMNFMPPPNPAVPPLIRYREEANDIETTALAARYLAVIITNPVKLFTCKELSQNLKIKFQKL